jgi:hypothetical protein
MQIRTATIDDLTAIAQLEAACFPILSLALLTKV